MTTEGPISICTPRPIGPLLRNRPLEMVFTMPAIVRGGLSREIAGICILPPTVSEMGAPMPAAIACCTACSSCEMAASAVCKGDALAASVAVYAPAPAFNACTN